MPAATKSKVGTFTISVAAAAARSRLMAAGITGVASGRFTTTQTLALLSRMERGMSSSTPIPEGHPLKIAWDAYQQTEDFKNTRYWAHFDRHLDGSLWAAFMNGWAAACGGRIDDTRPQKNKNPPSAIAADKPSGAA